MFSCAKEANGDYVMVENAEIKCFEGIWMKFYMPVGGFTFLAWCLFMPIRLAYLACRAVRRRQQFKRAVARVNDGDDSLGLTDLAYIQLIRDKVRYGCTWLD